MQGQPQEGSWGSSAKSCSSWLSPGPCQDLCYASAWLRMLLTQAMFIQGMNGYNYRNDVMITGNPCPVEIQTEKYTLTAIC